MKIKWEKNSISKSLAQQGKIKDEDIIEKTQTQNFPAEVATVRIHRVNQKYPHVTLHIRGKSKPRKYAWMNGASYECAETCRVNFGGEWQGTPYKAMDSNGNLDESYNWLDVHNAVEEIKELMGM